jgi:hypothetical protein
MNVHSGLFARKEVETERTVAKNRWAHRTYLNLKVLAALGLAHEPLTILFGYQRFSSPLWRFEAVRSPSMGVRVILAEPFAHFPRLERSQELK